MPNDILAFAATIAAAFLHVPFLEETEHHPLAKRHRL